MKLEVILFTLFLIGIGGLFVGMSLIGLVTLNLIPMNFNLYFPLTVGSGILGMGSMLICCFIKSDDISTLQTKCDPQ